MHDRQGPVRPSQTPGSAATRRPGGLQESAHHRPPAGVFKLAAAASLVLLLQGCSLSALTPRADDLAVTGSIDPALRQEGVDGKDAEVINTTVAGVQGDGPSESALAWSNPDTGSRGTIIAIENMVGESGRNCRKFQTTLDNFAGISLYKGETCEVRPGKWTLNRLFRDARR